MNHQEQITNEKWSYLWLKTIKVGNSVGITIPFALRDGYVYVGVPPESNKKLKRTNKHRGTCPFCNAPIVMHKSEKHFICLGYNPDGTKCSYKKNKEININSKSKKI